MESAKIKIGYAPTRREVFSKEEAHRYRELIREKIEGWGAELVDIDDINEEGLLWNDRYVEPVVKKFKAADVDGVFFPHCNFGSEHNCGKVAKAVGKPALLWGPRDDAPLPNGDRSRDSQCGLFATGKVLRRFGVPFTYITNTTVESKTFENGYKDFVKVCNVVKSVKNLRILQIETRPEPFWTTICNEGELLERFGVQVFPVTLTDLALRTEKVRKEKNEDFRGSLEMVEARYDTSAITEEEKESVVAIKTAMKELCLENGCRAIAIQCWNSLQSVLHVVPCLANGLLTEEGIPTVCETDIHGAITAIMMQAAAYNEKSVFFADVTVRHPSNDNAELLWHCGNFPPSLAKNEGKIPIDRNFLLAGHEPGIQLFEVKHGDVTVCRFDGDNGTYSLLIGEGKGVEGPATKGTYIWMEVSNWPYWEEKIVTGPYIHHVAGAHGKYAHILYEACKYIPGLTPDPAEPCEAEIKARLRGME